MADGLITLYMELNNVEEYLKNAQESKRLSKDSYGGSTSGSIGSAPTEPLPPPLPPRFVFVCNIWCSNFLLVVGGFVPLCDCMQVLLTPPFSFLYTHSCACHNHPYTMLALHAMCINF